MRDSTLRSRIIFGFSFIIMPLLVFLMYNNWYAMEVVREQVAGSNRNIIKMYGSQVDSVLNDTDKYLLNLALQNSDLISLDSYPAGSMEAYFAKVNTWNRLCKDIYSYNSMDAFFAFGIRQKEMLIASQQQVNYYKIRTGLEKIIKDDRMCTSMVRGWTLADMEGDCCLVRLMDTGYGSYVGAVVNLNSLLGPVRFMEFGDRSQVLFASPSGQVLAQNKALLPSEAIKPEVLQHALCERDKTYSTLKIGSEGLDMLAVSRRSEAAELYLVVLLPINALLEKLPFFQRLIYSAPVIMIAAMALFLIYLQRSIATPVHKLLGGMKKLQSGNFSARLKPSPLKEFNIINDAFNDMAGQIEHLKLEVYEEKLCVQKAEMKHLQAQIHPHFFTNCLNLIYNLAQVKNTELVQKLALYLVRHFRFMTRTNLSLVTLSDELEHIRNYLNIQKVRFPEALCFEIEVDQRIMSVQVPPLIIQPFVENAMEHGFCYKEGEAFSIRIEAKYVEDLTNKYIVAVIEDNGKGFSSETLLSLQSGRYLLDGAGDHIGIWSVQRRCQLYYSSDVQLSFANKPEGGAMVVMRLPL